MFEDNILREIRADPLALAAATTKALDGSTTFQITLPEFCLCLVRIGVIRFQGQTRCGLRPITLQLLPSSCLALFLVDVRTLKYFLKMLCPMVIVANFSVCYLGLPGWKPMSCLVRASILMNSKKSSANTRTLLIIQCAVARMTNLVVS